MCTDPDFAPPGSHCIDSCCPLIECAGCPPSRGSFTEKLLKVDEIDKFVTGL